MTKSPDSKFLSRVSQLDGEQLTPAIARKILSVKLSRADIAHIEELGEKSNEGLLTPDEHKDYQSIVDALDTLGILKSRARLLLRKVGKTA